jgi:hypothetical protein
MSVKVRGLCLLFFFTLLIGMRDFLFTEKKKKKKIVWSAVICWLAGLAVYYHN